MLEHVGMAFTGSDINVKVVSRPLALKTQRMSSMLLGQATAMAGWPPPLGGDGMPLIDPV